MSDQTPADLADKVRKLARDWAEHIESNTATWAGTARVRAAARVILNDVPAPTPQTLADMTMDEQDECTGMQADLAQGDRVVILDGTPDSDGLVQVLETSLDVYRPTPQEVTPRPDLPRLEWPGTVTRCDDDGITIEEESPHPVVEQIKEFAEHTGLHLSEWQIIYLNKMFQKGLL